MKDDNETKQEEKSPRKDLDRDEWIARAVAAAAMGSGKNGTRKTLKSDDD